jgi:16S rRNA G1207 methylase RsmC
MFRNQIVVRMGFSLINQNFVDALAKYIGDRSCLEVMCGTGALSASLKAKNTNIIATDSFSWETENTGWNKDTRWCEIKEMDAVEAVKRYGADTEFIIMSWPPYNDDTAYKVLIQMREVNPDCRLIYIGESEGGCTANDNFFENAVEIEDDEEFNKVCCFFQRWDCIHDCPRLYK